MTTNAKDSKQVEKIRKKLEKMITEEQTHFNKETLNEMRLSIHKWLDRHEPERESNPDRTFTLFDENKNSSEIKSKFVLNLLDELKKEQTSEKARPLAGRVTLSSGAKQEKNSSSTE